MGISLQGQPPLPPPLGVRIPGLAKKIDHASFEEHVCFCISKMFLKKFEIFFFDLNELFFCVFSIVLMCWCQK
jgi:uncharacterized protein (UPF0276 family)